MSPSYGQLVFPVNPEKIEIGQEGISESYKLLNVGEVVVPGGQGLKSFSFSSLLPATAEPGVFIERLESTMATKEVVRLIIARSDMEGQLLWDCNYQAIIKSFSYQEKGGEVGTVFFDIQFTEYRPFTVRVIV